MAAGRCAIDGDVLRNRRTPCQQSPPGTPQTKTSEICERVCPAGVTSRTLGNGTTEGGMTRGSARAERQQNFLADRLVNLVEIQRCLAFIAQHFEYGRPALL